MSWMHDPFAFLEGVPPALTVFVVFVAAFLEYACPPLPADTFVLAGGALVGAGRLSWAPVTGAALLGSTAGAAIQWAVGARLAQSGGALRLPRFLGLSEASSHLRFREAFAAYGLWVVVVNRAFPGVRAVTFVAAGLARLPFAPVMLAGLLSNVVWTALLLGIGVKVGGDAEQILETFVVYRRALLIGGCGAVVLFALIKLGQRHRRA